MDIMNSNANVTVVIDIKSIRELVTMVKETYHFDFGDYAITSFKRRLERALLLFKCENMNDLINKIKAERSFYDKFLKEVTVNTTEMFRDPSFWRKLRDDVIPSIPFHQNIRIWQAACSSGEEVYSMAILLKEMGMLDKVLISASDINSDVVATAQKGLYSMNNMELNQSNYERFGGKGKLSDYYTVVDGHALFNPSLIANVSFKIHDLVQGAAFSKFDIILCRNVFIYFNMNLQDRVVQLFTQCLYNKGFLAVGSKETIAWCKSIDKYSTYSIEEKIYQKLMD